MGIHQTAIETGSFVPFGCSSDGRRVSFCIGKDCDALCLNLYHKGKRVKVLPFDGALRMGNVWRMCLSELPFDGSYAYTYTADGEEFSDPYGRAFEAAPSWGKRRNGVLRAKIGMASEKHLAASVSNPVSDSVKQEPLSERQEKQKPFGSGAKADKEAKAALYQAQDYADMIIYRLHVRGFTRDGSSGVAAEKRGSFEGIIEKIPYLRELGITVLELMPPYEYHERPDAGGKKVGKESSFGTAADRGQKNLSQSLHPEEKSAKERINYWGFTSEAERMAPKAAFGGREGFLCLKDALHEAGIALVIGMYFDGTESSAYVAEVLRTWRFCYGADGVHIIGFADLKEIQRDPYLSDMLLWVEQAEGAALSQRETHKEQRGKGVHQPKKKLGLYNDSFQNTMRRFLKGDDDMIGAVIEAISSHPEHAARINYMANVSGFSLMDVLSYDRKHNEENGEHNTDGTDYNYSWNCGEEGISRKKRIKELRTKLYKNALLLTFLSHGTPLLNAGDEMGHTKHGNNNGWCQDNLTEWIDWKDLDRNHALFAFTKALIALRKRHSVFRRREMMKGSDYLMCGMPDVSFHGETAWKVDYENFRRQLGILYCGAYGEEILPDGKKQQDQSFYLCYNMHWEAHEFMLPRLPKEEAWQLLLDTSDGSRDGFSEEQTRALADQKRIKVSERSAVLLVAKKL